MINLSKEQITDMMTFVHLNGEQDLTAVVKVKDLMQHYEERPRGEWKETGYEADALGITYRQTQCSNCGWEHALSMWWNFCPNCGADMRKPQTQKLVNNSQRFSQREERRGRMTNYNELRNGQEFYANGYKQGYEDAIKALELASKKAEEAVEVFKQGLDKAEEQAKQMLGRSDEE